MTTQLKNDRKSFIFLRQFQPMQSIREDRGMNRHFFTLRQEDMGPDRESARRELASYILSGLRHAVYTMQGPRVLPPPLEEGFTPIVVSLFEEGSTRTNLSNHVAADRKGCNVISLDVDMSSLIKGEILEDTIDTIAGYQASFVVMRTGTMGAARQMANVVETLEGSENWIYPGMSIISGGEGPQSHAQQFVLDLTTWTAEEAFIDKGVSILSMSQWSELDSVLKQESEEALLERICRFIDSLKICFVGDSENSRIVSSARHVAEYFDISYLFVGPKQLRIRDEALATINAEPSSELADAKYWPRIYALRTQLERLTGTPDAPGQMNKRDAIALIEKYSLSEEFIDSYDGRIYHARPRDGEHPMIPLHLKNQSTHPKLRYLTQSFFGVPVRMGIFQHCYEARHRKTDLIPEPMFDESQVVLHSDPNEAWADHQLVLKERYEGRPMTFMTIGEGYAMDRLHDERWLIHDQVGYEMNSYKGSGPVSRNSGLYSSDREVYKSTIAVFESHIDPLVAAVQGLISPGVRFSFMRKDSLGPNAKGSYQRVEFPLPLFVKGFKCIEPRCMTNRRGTAACIHRVKGEKGVADKDGWPKASMECIFCETLESARVIVMHKFGQLLRIAK